ncbi:syntaphilin isoform X1 [Girardinichthys multiradiatus]|uniref:syntaphilin isoform X1 n=1 Tax=Girardinichthys multiradiatus TaxID=208333 RepID=UPI001FAD8EC1|nr:syntaphilin isoform X1 [Girardinichthys multiradiatus]
MSLTPSRKSSSNQRSSSYGVKSHLSVRRSVGTSGGSRGCSHSDTSSTYTYPGRIRASDGSPTARTNPSTPRRQINHTACINNHGIKPPTPEQYLTPLQQKEVCIRHLRARLRENVERLQHRDYEIEELRTQLYKMQEDWIKEECNRLEAQLALKEARKEIKHLHEVVESVKSNTGVHEQDPHDYKPYSGLQGSWPGGKSRSCGCSPASTLSRGTTFTRQSSEALQLDRSSNAPEPSGAARSTGQTHLLLEAGLLSEQLPQQAHHLPAPPAVSRSSTFERLYSGGAVLPISHSCHTLSSSCRCSGQAYLPHHHLFLHLPQDEPPVSVAPAAVPAVHTNPIHVPPAHSNPIHVPPAHSNPIHVPAAENKPEVRSQGCSPTMTWLSEESSAEQLSIISLAKTEITPLDPRSLPTSLPPLSSSDLSLSAGDKPENITNVPADTHICQPRPVYPLPVRQEATVVKIDEDNTEGSEGANEDRGPAELSHWSRYFLVDLLALAMPVVPTMAWLCRGAPQEVMPVYHIGSLLRGCCAVALRSLRRQGADRGRRLTSMTGATSV